MTRPDAYLVFYSAPMLEHIRSIDAFRTLTDASGRDWNVCMYVHPLKMPEAEH